MKWFKVHAEIINDPKIRALAFEDRWHFVAVMALTADGTLDEPAELRDELVSVALGLHGIDLEKAKARLMRLRLIGEDWKPTRWEKRQASADPTSAERQRRWKESVAQSKSCESETVSNALGNALGNGQKKKEKEKEKKNKNMATASGSRDTDEGFARFWEAYPRKVKKPDALRAWKQTAKERPPLDELLAHLIGRTWGDDPQFVPHPASFLRGHQWNDSPLIASSAKRWAGAPTASAGAWR